MPALVKRQRFMAGVTAHQEGNAALPAVVVPVANATRMHRTCLVACINIILHQLGHSRGQLRTVSGVMGIC